MTESEKKEIREVVQEEIEKALPKIEGALLEKITDSLSKLNEHIGGIKNEIK